MWLGEKHKEALATLKYGILDNKGFLLLTGDVGTGKTTLINSLLQSLDDDVICTSVPDPGLEKMDFFNYIAAAFDIDAQFSSKGAFLAHFRRFLMQANENKKKVLLIIDEAQLLTQELLEEIRLLSNIEKTDTKLINIFFVGQNEFNEILNREQNRAVRQRLTLNYNIDPLSPEETAEYIRHRLAVAGAKQPIFDTTATREVFMYSGGFPRRINVICDHCLLSGYVNEQKVIGAAIVKECAKELRIPEYIPNRNINGYSAYEKPRPKPVAPAAASPEPGFQPQQPVFQPIPQQRPVEPMPRRSRSGLFAFFTVGLLIFFLVWFLFFPSSQEAFVSKVSQNWEILKNTFISRSVSPPAEPVSTDKTGPLPSPEQNTDKKKDTLSEPGPKPTGTPVEHKDEKSSSADVETSSVKPAEKEPQNKESTGKPVVDSRIQPIRDEYFDETKSFDSKSDPIPGTDSAPGLQNRTTALTDEKKNDTPEPAMISSPPKPESPSAIEKKEIPPLPEEKVIVRFKYNTNDLTQEGYARLVDYSEILAAYPDVRVLVTGYTDSDGYQKYNRKLSEFRANIVRSFLLGRGIKPEQVKIRGLGSKNPIESNDTAWGRKMNRRVEIEVVK